MLSTSVSLGTAPPLKDLKKRLSSGALAELPEAAVRLDRFIDNAPLEDWEDAVWSSVSEQTRGSREIQSVTGTRLPGVERTNDFLCLVFSCFNGEGHVMRNLPISPLPHSFRITQAHTRMTSTYPSRV